MISPVISPDRDERGVVLVFVALVMTALLIVAALVIDIGNAKQERRQSQNAADAAALAGATDIENGETNASNVVSVIKNYVTSNDGTVTWSGCADSAPLAIQPDNGTSCISWDANPPATTKVRVVVPTRNIPTAFGQVINIGSLPVTAAAVAQVGTASQAQAAPCALCTLGSSHIQNGTVTVTGGSAYIGGDIDCNPQGKFTTHPSSPQPPIDVHGSASGQCLPAGGFNPSPTTGATQIPDPLSSLPAAPNENGLSAQADCNSGTAVPGIYNNIGGSCTLSSGLYVVTGTLGGNGSGVNVVGHGVTIFFTCGTASAPTACSSGQSGGTAVTGGSSNMDIAACTSAPCAGGATQGMALWFDRNDTTTLNMHGTGNIGFAGTVYGASATIDIKGSPAGVAGTCAAGGFCSEVVAGSFNFSGQGTLSVTYSQSQNVVITGQGTIPELIS